MAAPAREREVRTADGLAQAGDAGLNVVVLAGWWPVFVLGVASVSETTPSSQRMPSAEVLPTNAGVFMSGYNCSAA